MAKASWCTVSPTSGLKNGTIAVSASAHTGRLARSTTVTVQNQGGTKPSATIGVSQAAKAAFLTVTSTLNPTLPTAGGAIVIASGKSNVAKLTFNTRDGNLIYTNLVLKINGSVVTGFTEAQFTIPSDPGGTAEYTFEISATFPASTTAFTLTEECILMGEGVAGGVSVNLSQTPVASTLSLDKSSLSLANAGTVQNVAVTSNDRWTVS